MPGSPLREEREEGGIDGGARFQPCPSSLESTWLREPPGFCTTRVTRGCTFPPFELSSGPSLSIGLSRSLPLSTLLPICTGYFVLSWESRYCARLLRLSLDWPVGRRIPLEFSCRILRQSGCETGAWAFGRSVYSSNVRGLCIFSRTLIDRDQITETRETRGRDVLESFLNDKRECRYRWMPRARHERPTPQPLPKALVGGLLRRGASEATEERELLTRGFHVLVYPQTGAIYVLLLTRISVVSSLRFERWRVFWEATDRASRLSSRLSLSSTLVSVTLKNQRNFKSPLSLDAGTRGSTMRWQTELQEVRRAL